MSTLERLRNPSDAELARLDVAEVDLACAAGLPGSERLDVAACLAKIDAWAAWVRRYTEAGLDRFRERPEDYDRSPGLFRMIALVTVLQKGAGVRYNPDRIDNPWEDQDSRDDFIHGVIDGPGGTCASMPVLTVAVGRRLGYPLKLVPGHGHLFARWEEPGGERFNVECSSHGLHNYPDDYYRTWPRSCPEGLFPRAKFLKSMTPREEVAAAWMKRGHVWRAHGNFVGASRCYATACSIDHDNPPLQSRLSHLIREWHERLYPLRRPLEPFPTIEYPAARRYPGIPLVVERELIALDVLDALLTGRLPRPGPEVTRVHIHVD